MAAGRGWVGAVVWSGQFVPLAFNRLSESKIQQSWIALCQVMIVWSRIYALQQLAN